MDCEVLPYHWDDRKKLFADQEYLRGLYERVLIDTANWLNAVHGQNRPVRYWRIIVGPWLFRFVCIFFDRYATLMNAAQSGKVTSTWIGQYSQHAPAPADYESFSTLVCDDEYNHFLFSWIIKELAPFPFQALQPGLGQPQPALVKKTDPCGKRFLKRLVLGYERRLPHRFNRYVFVSSYFGAWDQALLQISLGQWPSFFPPQVEHLSVDVNPAIRASFTPSFAQDRFEELLARIIPSQFPRAYLEEYASMKERALSRYPRRPEAIFTTNGYYANEGFKFFAAEQIGTGTRLAGGQHGGLYGMALFNLAEDHEIAVSDRYYTWGWESIADDKVKPLPAIQLNRFRRDVRPDRAGRVLLVLAGMPRYFYHMYSTFLASSGALAYFDDQYAFVRSLSEENKRLLLVRLYMHDYGWDQKARWEREFQDIECDHGKESLCAQLKRSRLFVGTYNSTTYLEAFAADFPTLLFWTPGQWELRPSAKEYFDELRDVGILFDSPDAAALKVNQISGDPWSWWHQPQIQKVKDRFCDSFARSSGNWVREWGSEFRCLAERRRAADGGV